MLPICSSSRHIKCAISIVIFCLLATLSEGREQKEQEQPDVELVPIVKSLAEQKQDGSYYFAYEAADGSYREEVGLLRRSSAAAETETEPELEVSGVYRYVDSNGQHVEVSYVADKHGFRPEGNIIHTEISKTARGRT